MCYLRKLAILLNSIQVLSVGITHITKYIIRFKKTFFSCRKKEFLKWKPNRDSLKYNLFINIGITICIVKKF